MQIKPSWARFGSGSPPLVLPNVSRLVKDVVTDAAGNIYATGTYYDTITIAGTINGLKKASIHKNVYPYTQPEYAPILGSLHRRTNIQPLYDIRVLAPQ